MPVIQDQEFIDLCNACLDEKIDFAYELLYKQRSLVRYTLETFNSLRVSRVFKIYNCCLQYKLCCGGVNSLENRTYSVDVFLALYSTKLDERIDENLDIDFLVND